MAGIGVALKLAEAESSYQQLDLDDPDAPLVVVGGVPHVEAARHVHRWIAILVVIATLLLSGAAVVAFWISWYAGLGCLVVGAVVVLLTSQTLTRSVHRLAAIPVDGMISARNVLEDRDRGLAAGDVPTMTEVVTKTGSILFLDVVGWSNLKVAEIRAFVEKALPQLDKIVRARNPWMVNTWGDAIVAVFDSSTSCAETALELCDFFEKAKASSGVPHGTSARVGLHMGEVFACTNPITKLRDIFGPAVHKAARLEPITAAGHVFCTSAFARCLDDVDKEAPKAHPIGVRQFAKGYTSEDVFVVTWPNKPAPPVAMFQPATQGPASPASAQPPASAPMPQWLKQCRRHVKALYDLIDTSNTDGSFSVVAAAYSSFGEGATLHMCQVWVREIMYRQRALERWGVGILGALDAESVNTNAVVADLGRWLPELAAIFSGLVTHVNGTPDASGSFNAVAKRRLATSREQVAKQLDKIQDIYNAAIDEGQRLPQLVIPKLVTLDGQ